MNINLTIDIEPKELIELVEAKRRFEKEDQAEFDAKHPIMTAPRPVSTQSWKGKLVDCIDDTYYATKDTFKRKEALVEGDDTSGCIWVNNEWCEKKYFVLSKNQPIGK